MNALIVTEGGRNIGFGHITRCCALRDALKAAGISTALIVNGDASVRAQFRGQLDQVLNWAQNLRKLFALIRLADIVVVDSYHAPLSLYKRISTSALIPVYIDDYVRLSYPPGIVVSGAIEAERFPYPKNRAIHYLCGAKYVLLRKEFWRTPPKKVRKEIRDVLISFGGIRRSDFIQRLLSKLSRLFPHWRFHVVLSKGSGSFIFRKNVRVYFGLNAIKMRSLMLRSDIAISGGGQTTNEMCACGLSMVGICFAKNQAYNIRGWKRAGVLKYAGDVEDSSLFLKIERILRLLSFRERQIIAAIGQKLVDGNGAKRVAKEILGRKVER